MARCRFIWLLAATMGTFRTILAIAVVLTHMPLGVALVGGRNAVQAFYLISGFLISYVIINIPAYRDPRKFLQNRALRLFPVYYVVLSLSLLASVLNPKFWDNVNAMPTFAQFFGLIVNLTLLGQDWTEFLKFADGKTYLVRDFSETGLIMQNILLVKPSWTLGVELSFYLIAPFIIRHPRRLILLFIASITARLVAVGGFGLTDDPWTYRFFPFELALFIAGAFSHQYCLPIARKIDERAAGKRLAPIAFVSIVLVCLVYAVLPLEQWVKTALFLMSTFTALPFLFIFQSRSAVDRSIGELSYPLYISHYLVVMTFNFMLKQGNLPQAYETVAWIMCLVACLIVAYLLKITVSDQIEVYRRKISRIDGLSVATVLESLPNVKQLQSGARAALPPP
jgi:peptidoglycan/LPS O-acetylase OafA/YrhL